MRRVAMAGYESLTPDDCLEVVDFIEANGDDRAISLRLLEPSFRKVIYARSEGSGLASAGHDAAPHSWAQGRHVHAHRRQGAGDFAPFIRRSNDSPTP